MQQFGTFSGIFDFSHFVMDGILMAVDMSSSKSASGKPVLFQVEFVVFFAY